MSPTQLHWFGDYCDFIRFLHHLGVHLIYLRSCGSWKFQRFYKHGLLSHLRPSSTTILVFWVWAVTASLTGFIVYENVRTLRSVIPVIGLNAVGFTFGLYFVRKMFTDYVEEGGTSIVFTDTFLFQFMYAFADIYGLIFLLTFIVRNRQVMEILMGDVRYAVLTTRKMILMRLIEVGMALERSTNMLFTLPQ
uniref:Uncharacterized protein n=1 Tax=Ditylenchus dipsaci TaxID=166011 RepID=A0A915DGD4_9BILA